MIEEILSALEKERELYIRLAKDELTLIKTEDGRVVAANSAGFFNKYFTDGYLESYEELKKHPVTSIAIRLFYEAYNWITSPKDGFKYVKGLMKFGRALKAFKESD
jgi:hypothetical protein